ncbi:DNA polymerase/3'-5' exonuclease PolX [Acetivibrio cellulolyticus]|uniref:DNA polymerase/3'-5' exonuclease PolX n=1 Tax=Acetivibrio cellulolyticus TaxID=35830 RepID=UPI0001E2D907|nr:DNA polymerase/3'-5' exonuclease PolX [Acetivibrio cellulolyticus]
MDKHEVSNILNDIGLLLEIQGESFFKSKAYYDASRTIELLDEDLEALILNDRLKEIKGIGNALTQKITELVTTGKLEYYENLKKSIPHGLVEMLKIPGFGPKKVAAVYKQLGITTIGELKYACEENRLIKLAGFGEKTQKKILEGIENLNKYSNQFYYPFAKTLADMIIATLKESGQVIRVCEGGSLRRKKETVKDIDILASSNNAEAVMALFTNHPLVSSVTSKGETKSAVILKDGINVDLRVVSDDEYPYALHHFTGSKEHNTALRHIAKQQGIKINEYGLFKGNETIKCSDEKDIFKVFGMDYIEPELRENNGELEAASNNQLPCLVDHNDIEGILHVHSTYSDGANTIEELVKFSMNKGYTYLGITDHSKSAYYAGGLVEDDIKRQHEEIDKLNEKYTNFTILKGIELDILPDGSLDYTDNVLSSFDFTIASVHSSFTLDEDKMTERVLKAISNKYVTILGHPTGRLLLSREPFKININEVIKACASRKVILEINANPHRLDMDWRLLKGARYEGCKFVICPDAHRLEGIDDIKYGVNTARKGWLEKDDIVNTRSIEDFLKLIGR